MYILENDIESNITQDINNIIETRLPFKTDIIEEINNSIESSFKNIIPSMDQLPLTTINKLNTSRDKIKTRTKTLKKLQKMLAVKLFTSGSNINDILNVTEVTENDIIDTYLHT